MFTLSHLILTTLYFAIPGPERLSDPDSHTCRLRASQEWLTQCLQPHLGLPVSPRRGEGGLNGTEGREGHRESLAVSAQLEEEISVTKWGTYSRGCTVTQASSLYWGRVNQEMVIAGLSLRGPGR